MFIKINIEEVNMKILKKIVLALLLLFFCVCVFFFIKEFTQSSVEEKKAPATEKKTNKKEYKASMIMAGDALYHPGVYADGRQADGTYNYEKQLAHIKPIVENYDLAYYNQESILGGTKLGLSGYPSFNSPQEVGDAFIDAGFNLVSLANNHTLDKGSQGVLNSASYWSQKKTVMTAGSYASVGEQNRSHIGEKNGIKYAFLAYTTSTNGIRVPTGKSYMVNLYDKEKVAADIAAVKDQADVILVSMHWGTEYVHTPTTEQKEIAEYLASLGVHVVIGSHPHVVQPIERIGETVVVYSLGNFISAQNGTERRIGLMASLTIKKTVEDGVSTVSIEDVAGDLVYTSYTASKKDFKVIPFYKLTNTILPNYQTLKTQYEQIVGGTDSSIAVGKMTA